jgi:hypothetical protein
MLSAEFSSSKSRNADSRYAGCHNS